MRFPGSLPALALVLAAVSLSASAATLYTSFGSGMSYDPYNGWGITSSQTAMGFTIGSTSALSEIDLAYFSGETANLFVTLYSSDFSNVLESWTHVVNEQSTQIVDLMSASPVVLSSGGTYWLAVSTSNGYGNWLYGSPSVFGQVHTGDGTGYTDQGAFQVLGAAATPEPASAALLLGCLGILGLRLRRRP